MLALKRKASCQIFKFGIAFYLLGFLTASQAGAQAGPIHTSLPRAKPPAPESWKAPSVLPSWEAPENNVEDGKKWSQWARQIVSQQTDFLSVQYPEIKEFCPAYESMNQGQQIDFWVNLTSAVMSHESDFNRMARMREPCDPQKEGSLCRDRVTGKEMLWSEGPFQLSYADVKGYPFCLELLDWEKDKEKFEKEMKDYQVNLDQKERELLRAKEASLELARIAPGTSTHTFAMLLENQARKARSRAFRNGDPALYTDRSIHDVKKNMTCALKILSQCMRKKSKINCGYWAVLMPDRNKDAETGLTTRDKIMREVGQQPDCFSPYAQKKSMPNSGTAAKPASAVK